MKVWKQRSAKLTPIYPGTDILGALRLASQIFEQQPHAEPKAFVIFSDMRNHTSELDMRGAHLPKFVQHAFPRSTVAPLLSTSAS